MDLMKLGATGEFVSGLAVIGSLIFVGMQIRSSNALAQGAAELEVSRMNMDYIRTGVETDLSLVWEKGNFDHDSISPSEKARYIWSQGMWLHMVQALYRQADRGLLPAVSWRPLISTLVTGLENPLLQTVWENNSFYLSENFRKYVGEKRAKLQKGETWRPERLSEF